MHVFSHVHATSTSSVFDVYISHVVGSGFYSTVTAVF
jgi:hypothetical protein